MKTKKQGHTPGPWRQGYDDGSGQEYIVTERLNKAKLPVKTVAVTKWGCSCCKCDAEEVDIANARLIAAAPDFPEAAKAVVEDITEHSKINKFTFDMLIAAIEKTKHEQSASAQSP